MLLNKSFFEYLGAMGQTPIVFANCVNYGEVLGYAVSI